MKHLVFFIMILAIVACKTGEDENMWDKLSEDDRKVLEDMQAEECKLKNKRNIENAKNKINTVGSELEEDDTWEYTVTKSKETTGGPKPDEEEDDAEKGSSEDDTWKFTINVKDIIRDSVSKEISEATFLVYKDEIGSPVDQYVQFKYNFLAEPGAQYFDYLLDQGCKPSAPESKLSVSSSNVSYMVETKTEGEKKETHTRSSTKYSINTSLPYFFKFVTYDSTYTYYYVSGEKKGKKTVTRTKWRGGKVADQEIDKAGVDCGPIGFSGEDAEAIEEKLERCFQAGLIN